MKPRFEATHRHAPEAKHDLWLSAARTGLAGMFLIGLFTLSSAPALGLEPIAQPAPVAPKAAPKAGPVKPEDAVKAPTSSLPESWYESVDADHPSVRAMYRPGGIALWGHYPRDEDEAPQEVVGSIWTLLSKFIGVGLVMVAAALLLFWVAHHGLRKVGLASDSPEPRAGARQIGYWIAVFAFNIFFTCALGLIIIFGVPFTGNFVALDKEALVVSDDGLPRFRANIEGVPYLHPSKIVGINDLNTVRLWTNSQGFRDREHSLENLDGTIRVAVVGDSWVFGTGVAQKDNITSSLQAVLDQSGTHPQGYEVLNFGIPGMNLEGMVKMARSFALPYKPDVLVFSFICDDMSTTDTISHFGWTNLFGKYSSSSDLISYVDREILVRYKMWRYRLDLKLMLIFPHLYRERVEILHKYFSELGVEGDMEVAVVRYCPFDLMDEVVAEMNQGSEKKVNLIAHPDVERFLNHDHATVAGSWASAQKIAKMVLRLTQASQSAE